MIRPTAVKIADFCKTGSGGTPSRSQIERYYEGGSIPWVKSGELRESVINQAAEYVTEAALKESSIKLVPAGAILLAMYGATVGRLGVLGIEATTNQAVCHIIPDPKIADTRYVFHALSNRVPNLIAMGVGGAQPNINQAKIKELVIPLPPLPEQIRIATILDQADALRIKRKEATTELDRLTQAIFIEMFGDPATNPKGWSIQPLSELVQGKPNNGIFKKNHEYGDGLPVIWVSELFRGNSINCTNSQKLLPSEREIEQYGLHHGDILFCRSSLKLAGIGYNNVYLGESNKALFECHVIRVTPDKNKIDPEFLNFALRMPSQRLRLFKHAKTVTMTTIDQDGLLRVEVPVPPLDLQKTFTEKLRAIWQIKDTYAKSQLELDALFTSLQHRAFRGEI
jgi:type I restriction enzyme S subunit